MNKLDVTVRNAKLLLIFKNFKNSKIQFLKPVIHKELNCLQDRLGLSHLNEH